MFWVYKCNSRALPYQVVSGDWAEFFEEGIDDHWGSTEWTPSLAGLQPGDLILAYQSNRNELVGTALFRRWEKDGGFQRPVFSPLQVLEAKVRPLKEADPAIAAIPAFRRGPVQTLYEIAESDARRLVRAAGGALPEGGGGKLLKRPKQRGGGFGETEHNRKVEDAAMRFVKAHYRQQGYRVHDVSKQNLGYDLRCRRGRKELHVEVKGTSSNEVRFVITRNERDTWDSDSAFVLAVVLRALAEKSLKLFEGTSASRAFRFAPISYVAKWEGKP